MEFNLTLLVLYYLIAYATRFTEGFLFLVLRRCVWCTSKNYSLRKFRLTCIYQPIFDILYIKNLCFYTPSERVLQYANTIKVTIFRFIKSSIRHFMIIY